MKITRRPGKRFWWAAAVAAAALALLWCWPWVSGLMQRLAGTQPMHVEVSRAEYPVKGIDISHHNGRVDFARVAADSVDFVIIKATQGVTWVDSALTANYDGATRAGLHVGFYHFFTFNRGGVKQGRHFLNTVKSLTDEAMEVADTDTVAGAPPAPALLPMVIDVESAHNPAVNYGRVVGRLRDMIGYLRRRGHRVMIYCNRKDYEHYVRGNFDDVDLWLASSQKPTPAAKATPDMAPPDNRQLWQHSHNGRVAGIGHAVDINTFNGSRDDFERWLNE